MTERRRGAITRREFVGSAVASTVAATGSRAGRGPRQRPNVLLILADDLGYGDLGCYGRPDYETPHLDRLAREGIRFTDAYSASPVCTPTRCAFITGRYPARTAVGLEEPLAWRGTLVKAGRDVGLSPDHPTVASLLAAGGYDTALVGKWHLGYPPKYGPLPSGFGEFFGIHSGAADYVTHADALGENDLFDGRVSVERAGYMTELLTERAVEYVSRRRERPFYLSLHYTAPHWPWQSPKPGETPDPVGGGYDGFTAGGSLKVYASIMRSLDDGVGRVLGALDRAGRGRDTLVVFTSDNGGERFSYNWPFTGQKFDLHEGGIRVPAMARWTGRIPAGRTTSEVAITMDWTATLLAVAGVAPDPRYPLDGADLLPAMTGRAQAPERTLFWRHQNQDAARRGRWKYLRDNDGERLFDLETDAREQADFAAGNPEMFAGLRAAWRDWESHVLPRPPARA
jgi:arylsulfatase A-like enzyme